MQIFKHGFLIFVFSLVLLLQSGCNFFKNASHGEFPTGSSSSTSGSSRGNSSSTSDSNSITTVASNSNAAEETPATEPAPATDTTSTTNAEATPIATTDAASTVTETVETVPAAIVETAPTSDTTPTATPEETSTPTTDTTPTAETTPTTDTTTTYYQDADGDGYGNAAMSTGSSSAVSGYVANSTDCNDGDAAISPAGTEVCDSVDNNCSGVVDEGVTTAFYQDSDGDGLGNAAVSQASCTQPSGYVTNTSDADDTLALVTLATEGVPQVGIYYADTASADTISAATELKTYLDKITGGSFTLSAISATAAATTKGIIVGTTTDFPSGPDVSRLVEDTTNPMTKEAIAIDLLANQVWLSGASDVAMSNVVVRFLDALGCRWFFQGPTWEVVPSTPTLTFSEQIFEQPVMGYRFMPGLGFYDPLDAAGTGLTATRGTDARDWARHNHMVYLNSAGTAWTGISLPLNSSQVWDGAILEMNTCPGNYTGCQLNFFNFGESSPPDDNLHPDPDNRYGWLTTNQNHRTIEIANPLVRDAYWAWLTERFFTAEPNGPSMPIEPGDGAAYAISQSASALKLGSGSDSDQMVTLANDMSSRARASTDSSINQRYVTFLGGYGHLSPPTISLTPHTTYVSVFPVHVASVGEYTTTAKLFDGWSAKGAELSIFDNFSYYPDRDLIGSNYSQSFDGQSSDLANDSVALSTDFKSYAEHGLTGAGIETQDNFGYHGLGYYLITKLLWNPYIDIDVVRDDFFEKAFGVAKTEIKAYFDLLDPMNNPQLVSRDFMAEAYADLAAATTAAESDSAVIARINDLKCYMHHNALWWQIYRAEHNSAAQIQLVKDLFSLDYRIRGSYMTEWQNDMSPLMPWAATQFADGSADWSSSNASASWRATSTYPTQAEIDAWFTADTTYYAPDPVTQVSFTGQPEAVSDFNHMSGASQGTPVFSNGGNGKPFTLALYTPVGTTSLMLEFNVGQFNTTSSPASPLTVTLTNANGVSYGTQTVNPGAYGSSAYQNVTFSSLPEKTGFTAAINPFGSRVYVRGSTASGIDSPMSWQLDKIARTDGLSSPVLGYYFYVPKGTTEIEYYWNRLSNTSTDSPIAIPFSGTGCYMAADGYTVTTPNDGTQTQCVVAPDNTITTVNDYQQVIKIPVTSGNDGKIWHIVLNSHGASTRQLWFYNIPPYLSDSPTSLVIPHDLVVTDGLTPR